jgi:hypothetical protein
MPPVKGVGEPCAGELHARFDGGWLETGPGDTAAYAPAWKRRESLAAPTGNRASRLPYRNPGFARCLHDRMTWGIQ